jgi:hypothetical protein
MARRETGRLCRLEAVTRDQSEALPEDALTAFVEAGRAMDREGAFESRAIAIDIEAFKALTGFSPAGGEFISPTAVLRSAEAATAARTAALGNARTALRNDYIALGVFLRVCAQHGLGLRAELMTARPRR